MRRITINDNNDDGILFRFVVNLAYAYDMKDALCLGKIYESIRCYL